MHLFLSLFFFTFIEKITFSGVDVHDVVGKNFIVCVSLELFLDCVTTGRPVFYRSVDGLALEGDGGRDVAETLVMGAHVLEMDITLRRVCAVHYYYWSLERLLIIKEWEIN